MEQEHVFDQQQPYEDEEEEEQQDPYQEAVDFDGEYEDEFEDGYEDDAVQQDFGMINESESDDFDYNDNYNDVHVPDFVSNPIDPMMDLKIDVSDNHNTKTTKKKAVKGCKLSAMLKKFGLNDKKYLKRYYSSLNVKRGGDFVDHPPNDIIKPSADTKKLKRELGTNTLMRISKMSKYICDKCVNDEWDGKYKKQWISLCSNQIAYTFGQTPTLHRRISLKDRDDMDLIMIENGGIIVDDGRIMIGDSINLREIKHI